MAFECKIAADSLAPCGARLTTFIVTYPRAIHSEIMTHRILTKSSASSRAIPTEKLIERVKMDPWIPDYIGANQKGMQPGEELSGIDRTAAVVEWLQARNRAVEHARNLITLKVHKGVINRLLEPWMWITVIISGTEWENFFGLRCHEAAEPHFQHIARMMKTARDASVPKKLGLEEWHLPLIFQEDWDAVLSQETEKRTKREEMTEKAEALLIKVSVGRCARVSYLNHEGKRDLQADIELHDRLMVQRPLHAAPAEHVVQAMDWPEWFRRSSLGDFTPAEVRTRYLKQDATFGHLEKAQVAVVLDEMQSGNYLGFKQYRKTLVDEHIGGLMP